MTARWTYLAIFALVVSVGLVACGGSGSAPNQTAVRATFDFSDAVGLDSSRAIEALASTRSSVGTSGLLKVMADGRYVETRTSGNATVHSFAIVDDRVITTMTVMGADNSSSWCGLAVIDQDGTATCLDTDSGHFFGWWDYDLGHVFPQVDADGAIYVVGHRYGEIADQACVLTRFGSGSRDVFTLTRDSDRCAMPFAVSPDGLIVVEDAANGWLRMLADPARGRAGRNLARDGRIHGFLADGSLLANDGIAPRRLLFVDGDVRWDDRYYVGDEFARFDDTATAGVDVSEMGSRAQDVAPGVPGFTRVPFSASGRTVFVGSSGVYVVFPETTALPLPPGRIGDASLLGSQLALVVQAATADQLLILDLETLDWVDATPSDRSLEFRRAQLIAPDTVLFAAFEIARNAFILGTYDHRLRSYTSVDVDVPLSHVFEPFNTERQGRPATPEPVVATPDLAFRVDGLHVEFDARSSDRLAFLDLFEWDFGDGNHATVDLRLQADSTARPPNSDDLTWIEHTYMDAGTYLVTLTVTDDRGNSATDSLSVVVAGD